MICDTLVSKATAEICEMCSNICHKQCTQQKTDGDNNNKSVCISCVGIDKQRALLINLPDVTKPMIITPPDNTGNMCATVKPLSSDMNIDDANLDTSITAVKQIGTLSDSLQEKSKSSDKRVNNTNQTAKKGAEQKDKDDNSEKVNIKMKDLRQKETKLRKWEEELKLKDSQIKAAELDRTRREAYISQVEARNNELENTIRILRRRLADVESADNEKSTHTEKRTCESSGSGINSLVEKIHDKVSNFLLQKVD